jgi:hypothetical protein
MTKGPLDSPPSEEKACTTSSTAALRAVKQHIVNTTASTLAQWSIRKFFILFGGKRFSSGHTAIGADSFCLAFGLAFYGHTFCNKKSNG